ncbi:MAG: hypothetical protein AVDCRST_MAG66-2552 [uncultured Pseudonocardia sp.]|uniref:Uncharacterized protein n=1 Tax=uncultured Pseudonocardia sp. TaxID=211455 RepID=A0A6J4PQG4_9PSEU|nr:MAG: hypothetical protein AVDCRST_MAG66-2552 [uncultured Pseudonocardia sp.]
MEAGHGGPGRGQRIAHSSPALSRTGRVRSPCLGPGARRAAVTAPAGWWAAGPGGGAAPRGGGVRPRRVVQVVTIGIRRGQ